MSDKIREMMEAKSIPSLSVPNFVEKLNEILCDDRNAHIISWSEDGSLFRVHSISEFSDTVLPNYFKHNNWNSFVRQLNMHGFNKITDTFYSNRLERWEFKHKYFHRDHPEDFLRIVRRTSRKSASYKSIISEIIEKVPSYTQTTNKQESSDQECSSQVLNSRIDELESKLKAQNDLVEDLKRQVVESNKIASLNQQLLESVKALLDINNEERAEERYRAERQKKKARLASHLKGMVDSSSRMSKEYASSSSNTPLAPELKEYNYNHDPFHTYHSPSSNKDSDVTQSFNSHSVVLNSNNLQPVAATIPKLDPFSLLDYRYTPSNPMVSYVKSNPLADEESLCNRLPPIVTTDFTTSNKRIYLPSINGDLKVRNKRGSDLV